MTATWRKSSRSAHNGACLEAASPPGVILVRDSKNPDGPSLSVSPSAWQAFLASLKT